MIEMIIKETRIVKEKETKRRLFTTFITGAIGCCLIFVGLMDIVKRFGALSVNLKRPKRLGVVGKLNKF